VRKIGLHVRIPHTILDALSYAHKLELPIFQFFLIDQIARRPLKIDQQAAQQFKELAQSGQIPYVHGSYFINLAHLKHAGRKALKREIEQAKQIGTPYIILHPGSATGSLTHQEGIAHVANIMNQLIKQEQDITFILENTAHGGKSVGSDIEDFKQLKKMIDQPERLKFCIDTAHAHTYGYDLSTPQKQEEFINLLDNAIGIDSIALIHLNDSYYEAGSRIDKHAPLGQGTIGQKALKSFVLHPKLSSIPLILELPVLSYEQEVAMLQKVKEWHSNKEL
jgi:deoxyribonuclease IV